MANFNELLDIVLESSFEDCDESELVTESALNPVKKFKKKLKEIKDKKPKEYSDNEEIKKFVDENYDSIDKVANILEKEPSKLRKVDIANSTSFILAWVSWVGFVVTGGGIINGITGVTIITLATAGFSVVAGLIGCLIRYLRANADRDTLNDLMKIRSALQKVRDKKLPESYRRKIEDLITSINDAEEEIFSRVKVHKESVSVDDLKLEIYESCRSGEITEEERDLLISSLEI